MYSWNFFARGWNGSKNVSLNSIGQDGQCNSGSGYVGNYAWKCDFAGNSVVTTNNCKNSCEVGASSQGVGMVQKTVSLNTNGTNGLCNDSQGYAGNYSWSCTTPLVNGVSQAVGSVTVNNCQLRTCVVGGSSGMVSKLLMPSQVEQMELVKQDFTAHILGHAVIPELVL